MTTFALVHGAWHGGDCWDPTAALLREAGHEVVAVDLPCESPSAGLVDYAGAVLEALAPTPRDADVVVVGHSLGGLTIPLVAAARPVREMVFVCAFVPLPGVALADDLFAMDDTFAPEWVALSAQQEVHGDGSTSWPADAAIEAFYPDCDPEVARQAAARLRRQSWRIAREPSPLAAYPDVQARAIVCTEDRVLNAESCARHAAERVGARITRLPGGHSPHLAQPDVLARALLDAT
jgi:pimeloyl-ACP methyl ester carboxylesterase